MNISVTFYLPFAVRGFACVQLLDLSGCGLDEWSQVSAFGCLPALKELRIDENLIQVLEWSGIELSVGDGFTKYPFALLIMNLSLQCVLPPTTSSDVTPSDNHFPCLQRLSASALPLVSWSDIDALDRYPTLRALRLNNLPLFAGKGASEVRFSKPYSTFQIS